MRPRGGLLRGLRSVRRRPLRLPARMPVLLVPLRLRVRLLAMLRRPALVSMLRRPALVSMLLVPVLLVPLLLVAGAVALDRRYPPDLTRAGELSPELRDAAGQVLNLRTAADGTVRLSPGPAGAPLAPGEEHAPVRNTQGERLGPGYEDLVRLLVAREDRRFYVHPGIDPIALLRAGAQLLWHGRVISGGSTLAMQVARMLEPHRRNVRGKLHDVLRALQLQAHLGRDGILRLYLTLAPMGGNIEGVRAASLLYFNREPPALDLAQAALLVGLPQSPARRRPDRFPDAAWRGARQVLEAAGETLDVAAGPVARAPLPALARHLAQHLTGRTDTTIDGGLQRALEALAQRELPWLGPDADIAALVLRNGNRAVMAYLGGSRYFEPGGMVDMARTVRSPGSTLKPVIYAMAFDGGYATPDTWLDDGPMRLGTYAPRNFDHGEHGPLTAAQALRQSLNRPAVKLLAAVGPSSFATALAQAGAPLKLPRGASPSAAMALGGAGTSLIGLATLYADLADDGATGVPHWSQRPAPMNGRLVSRSAARAVAAILRDQHLPPGVTMDAGHPVAFKTGTSYGFRDAWACGFTPAYTVVVWVGRRDGSSRPGVAGRDAAAPLLFRMFGLLPPEAPMPRTPQQGTQMLEDGASLIQGARQDVPDRRLALAPALAGLQPTRLRILFPPDGVDLAFSPGVPIDLDVAGGRPPYTWMADNKVLPSPSIGGRPVWHANAPGFVHLTVVDGLGQAAVTNVRLVAE